MDGLLRCSRYSFGPNRLHYCGPDANAEMQGYLSHGISDPGLEKILGGFRTLYPYLKLIARENHINDPFDDRVVQAYWIGNRLLEGVRRQQMYDHMIDEQEMKKHLRPKGFSHLEEKIRMRAVPHHSFHVLNIWKRTGNMEIEHTLETMDSCRVGWGRVQSVSGPIVSVETEPLIYEGGKLALGAKLAKRLTRRLESTDEIEQLKPGELVTYHWGVPCEVITTAQAASLRRYTLASIAFANRTI